MALYVSPLTIQGEVHTEMNVIDHMRQHGIKLIMPWLQFEWKDGMKDRSLILLCLVSLSRKGMMQAISV